MLATNLVICAVICIASYKVRAKYVEGELKTTERWAFLARFCFLSHEGKFSYEIEYDLDYAVQKLLLYYDTSYQWTTAYNEHKTCEARESVLRIENNQIINLTSSFRPAGCEVIRLENDKAKYRCIGNRTFRSARERWWFIAISNCQSSAGLSLKYRFWMTNGVEGDLWFEHFSADEFYILPMLIVFLLVELLITGAAVWCGTELKSRQLLHSTYKLFISSTLLHTIGVFLLTIAYGVYANNGIGSPSTKALGRMMEAASEICFILMLILVGKGYTITRARLRSASLIKITVFLCLYCVTYSSLFIHERQYFDPGRVLYVYESPAGYGLLALRLIGWATFVYGTAFTLKHYPEKNNFYLPFFFFTSLWFVSGPVIIIVSNHIINKWVREKAMVGVEHSVAVLGFLAFLVLTRPSAANKNFPYHVRTSQIGVMDDSYCEEPSNNGGVDLDHFPHHVYEPTILPDLRNAKTTENRIYSISSHVEERAIS